MTVESIAKDFFDGKIDRNTAIGLLVLAGLSGAQARGKLSNA